MCSCSTWTPPATASVLPQSVCTADCGALENSQASPFPPCQEAPILFLCDIQYSANKLHAIHS